jgi:type I restriction enzyme R subunit
LSKGAYGVLQVIKSFGEDGADGEGLATAIAGLYESDETAPKLWQEKEGLRKSLRQTVRVLAKDAGFTALRDLPVAVEEFALKHFAKA